MSDRKETGKSGSSDLYRDLVRLEELIQDIIVRTEDKELINQLGSAKNKIQKCSTRIIEAAAYEVLKEYLPAMQKDFAPDIQDINLQQAVILINLIEEKAARMGMKIVAAVYNSAARPVAIHCMDDAYIASFDVAENKAYTSAALKMSTTVLKNLSQPGQELYGIQNTNQGRIVIFGGGEPLIYQGRLIGALGVSGGTEEEDRELAAFGSNKLKEVMAW